MRKINLIWKRDVGGKTQYFAHEVINKQGSNSVEFIKSRISKSYFDHLRNNKNIGDITAQNNQPAKRS